LKAHAPACWLALLTLLWSGLAAAAAPISREAAVKRLASPVVAERRLAVTRLGEVGRSSDADAMVKLLFDDDAEVRAGTEAALWRVWGRSGDARVDALFRRGVTRMRDGGAESALAIFGEVIRLKPDFAEGWNKRATVLFFLGRHEESLADCAEVLRRNPHHFGALAGYGQIYSRLENYEKALEYFERALAINPNMEGVAMNVVGLRKLLSERAKKVI
jgi:tetratricopeptide (TPR) repeat protein